MADFTDFDWLRDINNADDLKKVFYRIKDFNKENDTVSIEQPDGSVKTYSMSEEEEKGAEEEGEEKAAEGEEAKKEEGAEKEGEKKTDWSGVKTEVEYALIDALPPDIREWIKKFRQFESLGKTAVDTFFSPVRSFDAKGNFKDVLATGEKVAEGTQTEKGELTGPYTLYYPDGNKMMSCNYNNGVMEGACVRYYPNGKEMEICSYKNGRRDGEVHTFNPDGTHRSAEIYRDGVKVEKDGEKVTSAEKTGSKATAEAAAAAIAAATPKKSLLGRLVDWVKEQYTVFRYKNMSREDAIQIAKNKDPDYKAFLKDLKNLKKTYKNDMEGYKAIEARLIKNFDKAHPKKNYCATWDRVQAKLKADKEAKDFKKLNKYRRMRAAFVRKQKGDKAIRKDLCKQLKALRKVLAKTPGMVDETGKKTPDYYKTIREFKNTHSAEMQKELEKDRKGYSPTGKEYYDKASKEVSKEVRATDHIYFGAFEKRMNKIINNRAEAARPVSRDGGR